MPNNLQASIFDQFKNDFFEGKNGDCFLKFCIDGEVVDTRQWNSYVLSKMDYFAKQDKFKDGSSKKFFVDLSQFYIGCKVDHKRFIDATFTILFDGKCDQLDIGSQYSVVRFREYLGLSYDDIFAQKMVYPATPEQEIATRSAIVKMLTNCTDDVLELSVTKHLVHLWNPSAVEFDQQIKILYGAMDDLCDGFDEERRLTPRATKLCKLLCDMYKTALTTVDPMNLKNGFGDGLVRLIELHAECGCRANLESDEFRYVVQSLLEPWDALELEPSEEDEIDDPANFVPELTQLPFLQALSCTADTTDSEIEAVVFLLDDVLRPLVWPMFVDKLLCELIPPQMEHEDAYHYQELVAADLAESNRLQGIKNDHAKRLGRAADLMVANKFREFQKEMTKRLQANSTKPVLERKHPETSATPCTDVKRLRKTDTSY